MDIKEYIQSGIIEQYVLGLANTEEAAELEQLLVQYPELNEAIKSFENSFEEHVLSNSVPPPSNLKALIEKKLFADASQTKIIETSFTHKTLTQKNNVWQWLAAACIILLIGSTALNFYFYSGYRNSRQQYEALLTDQKTLQANNASYKQSLEMFQDTSMMHIQMKGMPGKEENIATVLWDKKSRDVYIYAAGMQQTPRGMQYQLWAIVDGKPVSAGVINNDCSGVCKLEKIDHAQAFAITLEKEGGSPTPTLSEMFVSGKVS